MSVDTPWPLARLPSSSSSTVVSPSASRPPVTALTWYSLSRASRPVAALSALKKASIGPSPVKLPGELATGHPHRHPRERPAHRRRLDVERLQLERGRSAQHLVRDDRLQVERGDLLLLVRQILEALEGDVQGGAVD